MSRIERNHRFDHEKKETKGKSVDRRVARTRQMLYQALLALIIEKGYDAVTVEDICEQANIGRSTFYAHFTNKDDLKQSHLKRLRQTLIDKQQGALAAVSESARLLAFSLMVFEHAHGHVDHYRALMGSTDGAIALNTIRQTLCECVRHELARAKDKESKNVPDEFVVQYIVGAYMAILTWWLDGKAAAAPNGREFSASDSRGRYGNVTFLIAVPQLTRKRTDPVFRLNFRVA